jgi:glycosyltransferase involved in cell wall biosynthesis
VRALLERQFRPLLTLPRAEVWRQLEPGLARYYAGFGGLQKRDLTTSVLLKAPGPNGEKGVLYCSFEYNWIRLAKHHDARAFFSRYLLVGQSSGSPPDFAPAGYLAGLSDDPVFIGVSNHADTAMLDLASPVVRPIDLMACDWVEPEAFTPQPKDSRSIDIIMVANWLRLKRHWLLFEALSRLPKSLRVVLIGRNADRRTEAHMRQEARAFGARQDLEIHTNVEHHRVRELLCDARISLLFSYREGSCVAPVESMFADTPVGMMHGAHVGSAAYINEATGVLLRRRGLARQLAMFLERSAGYDARAWALQHVSCHQSSSRLNEVLRDYALGAGQPWTQDIAPLCWRYVPSYVRAEDEARLAPAVDDLERQHGVRLERFVYQAVK